MILPQLISLCTSTVETAVYRTYARCVKTPSHPHPCAISPHIITRACVMPRRNAFSPTHPSIADVFVCHLTSHISFLLCHPLSLYTADSSSNPTRCSSTSPHIQHRITPAAQRSSSFFLPFFLSFARTFQKPPPFLHSFWHSHFSIPRASQPAQMPHCTAREFSPFIYVYSILF